MKIIKAVFLKSATDFSQYPSDRVPEIAFAGRSNVGKSSMINCLVERRNLAHTSSTPGKTRLINFYLVNDTIGFADLPGYGYAKVSKEMRADWKRMVEEYFEHRSGLRLLILIVDLRRGLEGDEGDFLPWLKRRGIPALIAATKSDKLNRSERPSALEKIRGQAREFGIEVLEFSSRTAEGRDIVWTQILQASGKQA